MSDDPSISDILTALNTGYALAERHDELRKAAEEALSDIELVYDTTDDWVHDSLYRAMCELRRALEKNK